MARVAPLPADVAAALARGNVVEAVRLLRASTGVGMAGALAAIARHATGSNARVAVHPAASAPPPLSAAAQKAFARGDLVEAIRGVRKETGLGLKEAKAIVDTQMPHRSRSGPKLAPGEVPKSISGRVVLAALVIGGLVYSCFSH